MKKLVVVDDEQAVASAVWREAGALICRHPGATLLPAALLAPLMEVPYILPDSEYVVQGILALLLQAFAFYFYVAYAEEVRVEAQSAGHIPLRGVLTRLLRAALAVPHITLASVAAVTLPGVAAGLLVIPGLWLLTRWSLFAPVIVRERLGPVAALRRSSALARDHFELVFLAAAFALLLEEALSGMGAFVGLLATNSDTWGEWVGGSVAAMLILPLGSFATALVYGVLLRLSQNS